MRHPQAETAIADVALAFYREGKFSTEAILAHMATIPEEADREMEAAHFEATGQRICAKRIREAIKRRLMH